MLEELSVLLKQEFVFSQTKSSIRPQSSSHAAILNFQKLPHGIPQGPVRP